MNKEEIEKYIALVQHMQITYIELLGIGAIDPGEDETVIELGNLENFLKDFIPK